MAVRQVPRYAIFIAQFFTMCKPKNLCAYRNLAQLSEIFHHLRTCIGSPLEHRSKTDDKILWSGSSVCPSKFALTDFTVPQPLPGGGVRGDFVWLGLPPAGAQLSSESPPV